MNHSPPSAPPAGDSLPTTPPLPSIQTSPQPQGVVVGQVQQPGAGPIYIQPAPVYIHQQPQQAQPNYVYIQRVNNGSNFGKPTPLWLGICLVVSAMILVLGQLLCLKQAENRLKLAGGLGRPGLAGSSVGFLIAITQMTSDKVFYQVLYLMGVILVMVFGLIAAHGYNVGTKGWQLMLWAIIWWSLDMISYSLLAYNTTYNLSSFTRNYIIYLISVGMSFILFAVGWGLSFGKLFSSVPQKAVGIVLQIFVLITALMTMWAPGFTMISGGKFAIGTAGCVVGLVFIPGIYGIYTWLVYMKEKKMKRNDFVVDPSKLSVSVEDGKMHQVNQPLIVH